MSLINKYCTNCGNEFEPSTIVCFNCGLPRQKSEEIYPKEFCPECDNPIGVHEKYCGNCGRRTGNDPVNTAEEEKENQEKVIRKYFGSPLIHLIGVIGFIILYYNSGQPFLIIIGIILMFIYSALYINTQNINKSNKIKSIIISGIILVIILIILLVLFVPPTY